LAAERLADRRLLVVLDLQARALLAETKKDSTRPRAARLAAAAAGDAGRDVECRRRIFSEAQGVERLVDERQLRPPRVVQVGAGESAAHRDHAAARGGGGQHLVLLAAPAVEPFGEEHEGEVAGAGQA